MVKSSGSSKKSSRRRPADDDATSTLLTAASEGRKDQVVQIIDAGGQIDTLDRRSLLTALHKAAAKGRHATVAVIISLGSQAINQGDKYGQTPLHWAAFGGCAVTTSILLDHGAVASACDSFGRTAAHVAKAKGLDALLKKLISAGTPDPGDVWPGPGKKWNLKSYWTADGDASICMCCQIRSFSLTHRRHHCRQCGDVVCKDCTQMAKPPWHTPLEKTEMVCFTCTNIWSSEDSTKGIYSSNQIPDRSGGDSGLPTPEGPPPDAGIVDELRKFVWYKDWSRSQTEEALIYRGGVLGSYIVRPSSQSGAFALSFLGAPNQDAPPGTMAVEHRLIVNFNGGWFLKVENASGRYTSFDSIPDLLAYYANPANPKPIEIRQPYGTILSAKVSPAPATPPATPPGNPTVALSDANINPPVINGPSNSNPFAQPAQPPSEPVQTPWHIPATLAAPNTGIPNKGNNSDAGSGSYASGASDNELDAVEDNVIGSSIDEFMWDLMGLELPPAPVGVPNDPPPLPEPVYRATGFAEVDAQIRAKVIEQQVASWRAEAEMKHAAEMVAYNQVASGIRQSRTQAIIKLKDAATKALAVEGVEGVDGIETLVNAGEELVEKYLDENDTPSASLVTEDISSWKSECTARVVAEYKQKAAERRAKVAELLSAGTVAAGLPAGPAAITALSEAIATTDSFMATIPKDIAEEAGKQDKVDDADDDGSSGLEAMASGWRAKLADLEAGEAERLRIEKQQNEAATLIQSAVRMSLARHLATKLRDERAARLEAERLARKEKVEEFQIEWDAAETLEGRPGLEQMEATIEAATLEFGMPIGDITEIAFWTESLESRRNEVVATEQAEQVAAAIALGTAALAKKVYASESAAIKDGSDEGEEEEIDESDSSTAIVKSESTSSDDNDNGISGLEAALAAASECVMTPELEQFVPEWRAALAERQAARHAAKLQAQADAYKLRAEEISNMTSLDSTETSEPETSPSAAAGIALAELVHEIESTECSQLLASELACWKEQLATMESAITAAKILREIGTAVTETNATAAALHALAVEQITDGALRAMSTELNKTQSVREAATEAGINTAQIDASFLPWQELLNSKGQQYLTFHINQLMERGNIKLNAVANGIADPPGAPSLRKLVKQAQKFMREVGLLLTDKVVMALPTEMDVLVKSVTAWQTQSQSEPSSKSSSKSTSSLNASGDHPICLACGFTGSGGDKFCENCGHRFPEIEKAKFLPALNNSTSTSRAGSDTDEITQEVIDLTDELQWQFGPLDRYKAESLLMQRGLDSGCFLIREAQTPGALYSLSLRINDTVRHYRIVGDEDNIPGLSFKSSKLRFRSLVDLVLHYAMIEVNDTLPSALKRPCPKKVVNKMKVDEWEIPREQIDLLGVLGAGNFGEVRQGRLRNSIDVAVKTSKANKMTTTAFLKEADKMKQLTHPNLVKLYGVCTLDNPIMIVIEYLGGGCLLDFLHSRKGRIMDIQQQCAVLGDVAAGMSFMQVHHWIHGDLAARNLLVSTSGIVKICDFGHAVQTDELDTPVLVSQQLPVRWTAPEFYKTRRCSPEADVWSFGVIIFEVISRGEEPYASIRDNKEVMQRLFTGWRMQPDKRIPTPFYQMMLHCWQTEPSERPHFSYLADTCRYWKSSVPRDLKGKLVTAKGEKLKYLPPMK